MEYQKTLKIVDENLKQVNKALDELKEGRKTVKYHLKNSDENKKKLAGHKKTLDQYIAKEDKSVLAEQKKLDALLLKVNQLKKNIEQRQLNVKAYQAKKVEIDQELAAWQEQQKRIANLIDVIDKKEKLAVSEKKNWEDKRKGYSMESARWEKTASQAKDLYRKYEKFD